MLTIIADNGSVLKLNAQRGDNDIEGHGCLVRSSKVKTLANVDVEKLNSINDFVEYAVTESRLNQAANEVLFDHDENKIVFDRKKLGAFIKWVSSDVIKEESDTLSENDLSMRDVGSKLSKVAKNWFFEKELI